MSALSVEVPFPVFYDRSGEPLENGYVWIGQANLNPQTNPIQVYFDRNLTQPAAQPLRTLAGYISNAGTPAQIYVDAVNFSILVQDKNGTMVYNFPDGTGISPNASSVAFTGFKGQVGFVSDLADDDGSDWIGFEQSGIGSIAISVQDKLRQFVSVKDFGATGDGVTDDTVAIQAAIDAVGANGGGTLYVPEGNYKISSTLSVNATGISIIGAGRSATFAATNNTVNIIKIGGLVSDVFRTKISNLAFSGGNRAIQIAYNSALSTLEDLYISQPVVGIYIAGDYTTNPIKDTIINQISRIEVELPSFAGVYMLQCGDVYLQNLQVASAGGVGFGVIIDSGVTAVYGSNWNITACQVGVNIVDNAGISPNPLSLPTAPRQCFFNQILGDTCEDVGIQIEEGYQHTFVDCWGSGSTAGPGWVLGNGTNSIQQIALIGCRALGNSQDGFRWSQGNTDLGSQMVGCHAISNGYGSSNTYDGINVQVNNSGLIISGCNSYNDNSQGLGVTQANGINIEGNVTNVVCTGNNLNNADGNISNALVYASTTHTGNILTDNIGFNNTAFAASPAMAASDTPFVNPYGRPMLVYVNGGTVSAVKIDTITVATGTGYTAYVGPNHSISVVYTVAPSWSWVGM